MTWLPYIAIGSLLFAVFVAIFNPPVIDNVSITYLCDTKNKLPWVSLPYHHKDDGTQTFRVEAALQNSVFASGRVRIRPTNCMDAFQVNGMDVPNIGHTEKLESLRCESYFYKVFDLSQQLQRGHNNVTIMLTNNAGDYGIDIEPIYSVQAVLAMIACIGVAIYAGTRALFDACPELGGPFKTPFGRIAIMSFLPCLELAAMWATVANIQGEPGAGDHVVPTLAAVLLPFALLLRLADTSVHAPFTLVPSRLAAILSVATVSYASMLLDERGWSNSQILAIAIAGTVGSFFARTPALPFLRRIRQYPRALAVALAAALCPHLYWYFRLSSWVWSSGLTTAMVRGMLWMCGHETTTSAWGQKNDDGQFTEYWSTIASSDFSVSIASWCSGFEGVSLFFFLLSVFVLLDWKLFSKVRFLWAIYAIALPYVLLVNAFRISGVFLYAEYLVWRYNKSAAIWLTVKTFHSNIGWIVYSMAFAAFLHLMYRWARQTSRIR